jgi:hypothetical protein
MPPTLAAQGAAGAASPGAPPPLPAGGAVTERAIQLALLTLDSENRTLKRRVAELGARRGLFQLC